PHERGPSMSLRRRPLLAASVLLLTTSPASVRAQDPAVVNAKTIHVALENERIRVLEATLPPGTKEEVHSHPDYVIYVLAGGRFRNHASDGKVTDGAFQT